MVAGTLEWERYRFHGEIYLKHFFVEPRMHVTALSVTIIIVNICCDVSVCG